jgi:hypothetical protein
MRGTSGTPRRTKRSRYRCSLPGLAGFAGLRRTEPEVPRIGSRATRQRLPPKSSTAMRSKKEKPSLENTGLDLFLSQEFVCVLRVLCSLCIIVFPVFQISTPKLPISKHHPALCRFGNGAPSYDIHERYLRIRSGALPQSFAGRAAPAQRLSTRGENRARPNDRPARQDGGS